MEILQKQLRQSHLPFLERIFEKIKGMENPAHEAWEAANCGDEEAMLILGICFYSGIGAEKDFPTAEFWFSMAALGGLPAAQYITAYCYKNGVGVERDPENMAYWFRKAAEQELPEAQLVLSLCYILGDGVEKDLSEAEKWRIKAAENGLAVAQLLLAHKYMAFSHDPEGFRKAVYWARKAADRELPAAQSLLAICYKEGKGVEKDEEEAAEWFLKAATQGNDEALYSLALHHTENYGMAYDYKKAVDFCREIPENSPAYGHAQCALGTCYGHGYGVPRDTGKSVEHYYEAAKAGFAPAFFKLSEESFMGSHEFGYALALCYKNGYYAPQNYETAYALAALAQLNGSPKAGALLEELEESGELTEESIEWAKEKAQSDFNSFNHPLARLFRLSMKTPNNKAKNTEPNLFD